MVRQTRRRFRYGGKKRKGTSKRRAPRRQSRSRRRSGKKPQNQNSWGLNKGTSKGCVRVCLGSTLR
jgi:hypothetical protein